MRFIILLIFGFIYGNLFAQDIITKKNGGTINAKVKKVTLISVTYTKELNSKLLDLNIPIEEVYSIKYADGRIEYSTSMKIESNEPDSSHLDDFTFRNDYDIMNLTDASYLSVTIESIDEKYYYYHYYENQSGAIKKIDKNKVESIIWGKSSKFKVGESSFEKKSDLSKHKLKNSFYLTFGYGNSYQIFNQLLGENINKSKIDNESTKQTNRVFGTYGEGSSWSGGLGLMLKDKVGIEFFYFNFTGNSIRTEFLNTLSSSGAQWSSKEITLAQTHAIFQSVNGSLLFKFKWFYSRIGLIIADCKIIVDSSYSTTW